MNDLQRKQLEMLKKFIAVCEKNNLRYSAEGGTAIGAVRHHGFIPWDDDVDIMMPRDDYEKFLKLQHEFDGTPYFIQTWRTDPNYPYNFAKLRDSSTTFIENIFVNFRMNHGVWIDIFPIDGMSKKEKPMKKCGGKSKRVWWHFYCSYLSRLIRKVHKQTFFKDIFLNIVGILGWIIFDIGRHNVRVGERILKNKRIEDCALSGNCCTFFPSKEAMPSYIYNEYIKIPFEDTEIAIVKEYDLYLTRRYGNYMELPPEKDRISTHYHKGLSLTQGYKEYMKEHKI